MMSDIVERMARIEEKIDSIKETIQPMKCVENRVSKVEMKMNAFLWFVVTFISAIGVVMASTGVFK